MFQPYPSRTELCQLACDLNLNIKRVKRWFERKRLRIKKSKEKQLRQQDTPVCDLQLSRRPVYQPLSLINRYHPAEFRPCVPMVRLNDRLLHLFIKDSTQQVRQVYHVAACPCPPLSPQLPATSPYNPPMAARHRKVPITNHPPASSL